jgi:hypothetical protein
MKRGCVAVLLCSFLATVCGCATMEQAFPEIGQAPPEAFEKTRTYDYGYDEVWTSLLAVLAEFEFPLDLVEKDSGLVTTNWGSMGAYSTHTGWGKSLQVTLNPVTRCNVKDELDIPEGTRCKLSVLVERRDETTALTINATFEGWKKPVMKTPYWDPCNSTGALEASIFEAIAARLAG